jgi:hypothetical protein
MNLKTEVKIHLFNKIWFKKYIKYQTIWLCIIMEVLLKLIQHQRKIHLLTRLFTMIWDYLKRSKFKLKILSHPIPMMLINIKIIIILYSLSLHLNILNLMLWTLHLLIISLRKQEQLRIKRGKQILLTMPFVILMGQPQRNYQLESPNTLKILTTQKIKWVC